MAAHSQSTSQFIPYEPTDPDDPFRLAVVERLQLVDPKAAERYAGCHQEGHGWVEYCPHDHDHYQRFIPCSCMLRICPMCSQYLAGQIRDKFMPIIEALEYKPRPGWSLKLVTLTRRIALSASVGDEVLKTMDAAHDLYYRLWGQDKGAGGLASLEVGERGQKIHIHLIVYGRFFWKSKESELAFLREHGRDESQLSGGLYVDETWRDLTEDYIVDVREISADAAVKEGLKYVTKFVNLTPQQLVDLHVALKGRRRIRAWGCFYDIAQEEEPPPADIRACPVCNEALELTTEMTFVYMLLADQEQPSPESGISLDLIRANKSPPPNQLQLVDL